MIPPGSLSIAWNSIPTVVKWIALAVLVLGIAYCIGKAAGKDDMKRKNAKAQLEVERTDSASKEERAQERVVDLSRNRDQKEELDDVREANPPGDDRRRARGCAILRQQGRHDDARAAGC
ncbi:hypothetical protein WJT74_05235 [Sphingomicrobium sp. XHP0239]|uniref:hypothetical protein n=1 Tax=Sphingomicrobium maritimum TaxID=3133972 RepID=UPI0031CC6382